MYIHLFNSEVALHIHIMEFPVYVGFCCKHLHLLVSSEC